MQYGGDEARAAVISSLLDDIDLRTANQKELQKVRF